MDARERVLYHQIHPLKLATDFGTAVGAVALLWRHHLVWALVLGFVPSVIATVALLKWADLEPYRRSAFGQYVATFMTHRVEAARFAGLLPLWIGAWFQSIVTVAVGFLWIIGCWLWGPMRPRRTVRGS